MISVRVCHTGGEIGEQLPGDAALLEVSAVRRPDQFNTHTATGEIVEQCRQGALPILDYHEGEDLVSAAGKADTELGYHLFQATKGTGGKDLGNPHRLTDGFLVTCDYGRIGDHND